MNVRTLARIVRSVIAGPFRRSYSQFGEDAYIHSLLKNQVGVYVDIGAYHPITFSNTYAFYLRGWAGYAIDPNPDFEKLYRFVRPRDYFVNAAIGETGEAKYHMFMQDACNTLDEGDAQEKKRNSRFTFLRSVTIPVIPLASIIAKYNITEIDFLNIDVEGNDLNVLTSHDWTVLPRVIAIEDRTFIPSLPHTSAIYMYLSQKGYVLSGFCGFTLVWSRSD